MNYLDIKLPASDDNTYCLRDFAGQQVVLYFYPKDNTSGCTLEAKDFTCLQQEYKDKGYTIIGVSRDSVKSHKNFISKQELNLLLLSDQDEELVKAFDVLKYCGFLPQGIQNVGNLILVADLFCYPFQLPFLFKFL